MGTSSSGRSRAALCIVVVLTILLCVTSGFAANQGVSAPAANPATHHAAYTSIPLRFEPNRGQTSKEVRFLGRAAGYKVGLEAQKITFMVAEPAKSGADFREVSVPMFLVGSKTNPDISAFGVLPGTSSYFPTSNPRTWITNLPTFSGIRYREVYPSTDLIFHGDANRLEYDFNVAPGGDPRQIAWRLDGSVDVQLRDGDLVLHSQGSELRFLKPVAYQEKAGKREAVSSEYRLQRDDRGTMVQFTVGEYDRSRTLVIDPVLIYSTQISGLYNLTAMTTDAAGNVYAATAYGALEIAKLSPDGQTLLYNATIGSTQASAAAMAVDGAGQLYITGSASAGYATTANAYQPASGSGSHAFLTVLNAAGSSLVYSTYLQGSNTDRGQGLALDPSGKVLVSGWTESVDFPNTNNITLVGYQTPFIVKIDTTLSGNASLIYSAVLPAANANYGYASAVHSDSAGNAYAALTSAFLATTAGAFNYNGIYANSGGVYVAKIDGTGATQFIAYLGYGVANDIAVDSAGNSYVTGYVNYEDFPTTAGAYQTSYPNGFVTKLDPTGSALVFSTFLGGASGQYTYYSPVVPTSIAIPAGCTTNCTPYVSGYTYQADFPTINAIQTVLGGSTDAFVVNLTADGANATFATYLGGSADEDANTSTDYHIPQISLDSSGNMYLAGDTYSSDFPFTAPKSSTYSFIAKISPTAAATIIPSTRSYNFSTQTLTVASAPVAVKLLNLGSVAANISLISSSNSAFSQTNDCGGSIPAGSFCTMQLTFTPTTPGTNAGTITISHDGTNSPATVSLSGFGADQPLLTISPSAFNFGAQAVNTASGAQTFTITNIGTQQAQIYSVTVGGGHPEYTVSSNCPQYLGVGSSCVAMVTFQPFSAGLFLTYLSISASATVKPTSSVLLSGTGTGTGTASITASTTSMNFLDEVVGTSSTGQYIQFQNTGTTPVTMGPQSISGDFKVQYDSCNSVSVIPGSYCYVYVIFAPTLAGTRTGTLTVKNSGLPDLLISLSGVGTSSTPLLVFSPAAMVFADQVVGTQSQNTAITITNNGNAAITFTRIYDSGADFRLTYNGCSILAQYSQCTVYVSFTPSTTGALSGSVTFVDTASGSPQTVNVTGNGIASTASVVPTPSAATFDDTVVGANGNTIAFYLYNPGNTSISASAPISSSADFVVTYAGCTTIPANSYCQINVQFRPQSAGFKTGTVTIAHSAAGSPAVLNVSGTGVTAVDSIVASPLGVGFPDTVVGTLSSYQLVYFYNPGNTNVNLTSPPQVSGDFVIYSNGCGSLIYAASYCYVYVQFAPSAAGTRNGTLTLFDDAPGNPHTVSLTGNGVNPIVSLVPTPASLGFDDQVVGTTSGVTYLTLYNPGNITVTISNVSVAGDFAVGSGCASISANSYCSLPVTFTPTAAGQRTGTITFTDTAAGSPHGISVYGNGLAATTTVIATPAAMDFGNVVTSVSATAQTAYVTNTGNMNVTISSVTATAPFTVSGCVTTLTPGNYCSMSVSVNASTTGPQSGTITITDTASGSPQTIALTANGVSATPAITVTPNGLTFPQTVVSVPSGTLNVTFNNRSGSAITISGVAPTGDFAVASNGCASVANNSGCNVSVMFTPTAAGNRSGTLVYTHNGPGGTTSINLAGFGLASTSVAQLSATSLAFPDQVVGTSSGSQLVYFWNNGTVPITISSTTITAPFTITSNACTSSVSPGSYCYVYLNFAPSVTGAATGALTINSSDPGSPHVVQLSGNGVAPTKTLAISASSLQFLDQTVGFASSSQTLTIYNTGNTGVAFTSPSITGDYAITYNGCSGTLGAGSVCYVNVNFTPTLAGNRTGTLTLNNNAASSPQNILLAGNGVTATKTYVLSASAIGFSDSPLSVQSGTQYTVLRNSGTAPLVISGTTVTGDFVLSYNGCYAQTMAPGSACTVGILFQPTQTGARTGTATIATDATAGNAVISLSGNGVNQSLTARVSATALTFADQAVGTTAPTQYLYLYNTGNVALPVSNVLFSGDFSTTYNGCAGTISVGSYCYIYVLFTPTVAGTRTGSITITDGSTTSPHVVSLTGNGVTPALRLNINPGSLGFAPTATGVTSSYVPVTVTNVGNAPVQMGTATIASADFVIYYSSCDGALLSVGGYSCTIYVQFKPTTTGTLTGTLNIPDNATGNPHSVPLTGTGTSPNTALQLSQTSLTFANQPTNTTSSPVTVYLVNQGNTSITTSTVAASGDFLVNSGCTGTTVYQNSACGMNISFKPTATGTRTGAVTITDNAVGSPHVISLSGTGVTPFPVVTLAPNNLVFSNQNVATNSSTQTVTVYNTGSAPLNVTNFTNNNIDFHTTQNCTTAPVAVGSYCQVNVFFNPTAPGTQNVSVVLTDDAPGSPHSIALSGTGVASGPIASLNASYLTFSSQALSTTSTAQTVTIVNNGGTPLVFGTPTVSGPFAISANTCSALAPTTSCGISVTFTPTVTGLTSGTLTIPDNSPTTPHVVGLSGTGLAGPSLTISPTNLVFNSQQVNTTSAAQSVTVTNSGSTATVSLVAVTGAGFAQTNTCTTIATGSACTVSVTFTPTSGGTQTGTLTITDNAPGSPHTVNLSGSGVGQPAVSFNLTSLDFGNQNVGTTSAAQTVTLTNTGSGPLAIAGIGIGSLPSTAGADYSVTNNCGNNLSVNASCTLTITFHPAGANTRTGSVSVADNAPGSPQTISLTGVGIGAVASLSTSSLTFTSQTVATNSAAQTITLTNTGNATLNITSITSSSTEFLQTNNCASTLAATASCTISVTFGPTAAGNQGGYITVATDVSTQYVNLAGTGTGPVGTVTLPGPQPLNFGSVAIGTPSATQTITLLSAGTTALTVNSVSISGDFSQTNNCPASLAVNASCTVQVTFTPAAAGTRTGTLFISDNGSFSGHSISLTGTGLGPLITLGPSSLNFGTVALNTTTSPQSITVSNTGTATVTGLAIGAATGDFAQTNNCPATLAVSATCNINVTFKPTVAGSRGGSVSVTSNAPTQTATFTGAGSGPLVQLNPTSLSFGNVVQSTTSTAQTVTLTNGGNATLNISSIAANGDFGQTNNCPAALGVSSVCTISVTFTPSTVGLQSGSVTIVDDAGGSPHTIAVSGTGIVPQEDLVIAGVANPASIAPGGSTTYTFTITNNGPSVATSVNFSASLPTNAQVTSAGASTGSCTTGATITCTLANMPVNSTATVTIGATATANAALSTTASVSAAEPDPNSTNNQVTVVATVAVADLVVTSSAQSGAASPTYVVSVSNSGPAAASSVTLTCDYDRFGYAGVNTSQGSCSQSGQSVVCSLANLAANATANVSLIVQPPSTGWATIACHATAAQFDPNPVNNSAQINPDGATNTTQGDNIGVQLYDSKSGAAARVVFPSVKASGSTVLTSVAGANPPAGFRNGLSAWTYDVTTNATTVGSPLVTFAVAPTQFHHPANVRLFHMENGAWVDRTIANDPATSSVAAIAGSLSPFALFEPVNHAPVANAGTDRVIAGTSVLGATIVLDGSNSVDMDGDALSYRWSGPFSEGNGITSGTRPSVTLPFGTSRLTLVANDGEVDSSPVTLNVTVTDFGVAAGNSSVSLTRGTSTSIPITVNAVGGAFDQAVTLGCANLPAGMSCSFSPATVQPGANGATSTLTIASTTTAANHRQPAPWAFGTMLFGAAGVVMIGGKRRRHALLLTLALLALVLLVQVGCGGGGAVTSTSGQPAPNPSTTVTISVTGNSAGLQHASSINVTLH